MNDIITDRSIMSALGRQLTVAVAKQSVAASNLANLDIRNYARATCRLMRRSTKAARRREAGSDSAAISPGAPTRHRSARRRRWTADAP